jgi:hypothetical protein
MVNHFANFYQIYWLLPWFDVPVHIAGGFMVGLFAQTGLDYLNIRKNRILFISLFVILVGVGWELVEWYLGNTDGLGPLSKINTIKDIIDDIIGGVLSIWFWHFIFNKTKNTKIHDKQ